MLMSGEICAALPAALLPADWAASLQDVSSLEVEVSLELSSVREFS